MLFINLWHIHEHCKNSIETETKIAVIVFYILYTFLYTLICWHQCHMPEKIYSVLGWILMYKSIQCWKQNINCTSYDSQDLCISQYSAEFRSQNVLPTTVQIYVLLLVSKAEDKLYFLWQSRFMYQSIMQKTNCTSYDGQDLCFSAWTSIKHMVRGKLHSNSNWICHNWL